MVQRSKHTGQCKGWWRRFMMHPRLHFWNVFWLLYGKCHNEDKSRNRETSLEMTAATHTMKDRGVDKGIVMELWKVNGFLMYFGGRAQWWWVRSGGVTFDWTAGWTVIPLSGTGKAEKSMLARRVAVRIKRSVLVGHGSIWDAYSRGDVR